MAEVVIPTVQGVSFDSSPVMKEHCKCSASDTAIPSSAMSAASKRKKVKVKRVSVMEPRRSSSLSVHDADSCTNMSSSSSATSFSSATSVTVTKPEDMLWFHRALTMLKILRRLTTGDCRGDEVTSSAVADAAQSLSAPTAHTRALVITGLPQSSDALAIRKVIQNACNANGGLYKDELYMPTIDVSTSVSSSKGDDNPSCSSNQDCSNRIRVKGYAVVELRSKSKIESATKTLLDCQSRLNNLTTDTLADSIDGPSVLSVLPLNAMLFTEADGAAAIEGYLLDKLVSNTDTYELNTAAIDVFTDIFHSCYICAHNLTDTSCQQESGYICLSKDQIMMQVRISLTLTNNRHLQGYPLAFYRLPVSFSFFVKSIFKDISRGCGYHKFRQWFPNILLSGWKIVSYIICYILIYFD